MPCKKLISTDEVFVYHAFADLLGKSRVDSQLALDEIYVGHVGE